MVEEVREQVIRAAADRPYEGGKRVFVIEAAEAMRDESQNALLKTLEEPPEFVDLILLTSEPAALLETIASRCQPVDFAPLPAEAHRSCRSGASGETPTSSPPQLACSPGDLDLPAFCSAILGGSCAARGGSGRAGAASRRARRRGRPGPLASAARKRRAGRRGGRVPTRDALEEEKDAGSKRSARDIADAAKRPAPPPHRAARPRPEPRRLAPRSRRRRLRRRRRRLQPRPPRPAPIPGRRPRPRAARRAAELVQDTRRRLDLNVSEELALEALAFRARAAVARLTPPPARAPSPAPAPGPGGLSGRPGGT